MRDVYLVVFLADFNETAKKIQEKSLLDMLNKYVLEQVLHVIEAPREFYPELDHLKEKYKDSVKRTRWRAKQNIDYSFLMCYCKDISKYYLHLEDDVIAAPSFMPKLRDFISSQEKPWQILDASKMGHIGKVYHSEDLTSAASFFYLLFDEMPVDWLMMYWKSITDNDPKFKLLHFAFHTASLFEHLGVHSSLKGKTVNSTEQYFDRYDHKYLGLNPPAVVTSSLTPHKGMPQDAYEKGIGYFWSEIPRKGDEIRVSFQTPLYIKEVSVDTGSNLALYDFLKSAVLQINKDPNGCTSFTSTGEFKKGRIHAYIHKKVNCLRVLVTENQTSWIFLREINVWTK